MVYVYAWFDPRTKELRHQDYSKPPIIEHFDEVKYSGSTFGVWEYGQNFSLAMIKVKARMTKYFADRSQTYSKNAMNFAAYSKICATDSRGGRNWKGEFE